MVEEKVEAPERIWLQVRPWGYGPYWYEKPLNGTESVEYTRSQTNTRQRAERAAVTIAEMIERGMNLYIGGARRREMADIIAAEFQK